MGLFSKSYKSYNLKGIFCFERIYEKKQYISFLKWRVVFRDREFYSNGQLKNEQKFEERDTIIFLKSGHLIREGKWTVYYSNGKLKSEKIYKNNKLNGIYKTYNSDGNLSSEGNYKEGKKEGLWKSYHKNGQLESERNYKDGKKEGDWKIYDENGELKEEELDIEKILDSGKYGERLKLFFRDDVEYIHIDVLGKVLQKLISNMNIENTNKHVENKKEGLWITYNHKNGQLKGEVNFKDGKKEGLWKGYHENGQLESEGNYKDNKQEGLWKTHHENGQLESEGNYKDGNLIPKD